MVKLEVGQVIDLYNVKPGHHIFEPGQTLVDTGEYEALPQLAFGKDFKGDRCKSKYSVLDEGVDAVKIACFRIKKVKEVTNAG